MICFASAWAIVLRHMRMLRRDPTFLLGGFYWPILDILVWGFLGSWVTHSSQASEFHNYETIALLGILLWQVIGRGCNYMIVALSEELWSRNIMNLFSLPLRVSDWMLGVVIFYFIMLSCTTLFCLLIILALYDVSLWNIISTFFIFLPPLTFSAIWIGFSCLQIVITLGRRGVELGFVLAWFLLPFSGAYYPTHVLPEWAQILSKFLPMSYVFQGMRGYLIYNQSPTSYLVKAYIISSLYMVSSIILFVYCFNHSKKKGLARLAE